MMKIMIKNQLNQQKQRKHQKPQQDDQVGYPILRIIFLQARHHQEHQTTNLTSQDYQQGLQKHPERHQEAKPTHQTMALTRAASQQQTVDELQDQEVAVKVEGLEAHLGGREHQQDSNVENLTLEVKTVVVRMTAAQQAE